MPKPELCKYSVKYPEKKNKKQREQTNRKTENKETLKIKKKKETLTITTTNNTLTHNHKQVILSSIFYTEDII